MNGKDGRKFASVSHCQETRLERKKKTKDNRRVYAYIYVYVYIYTHVYTDVYM